MSSSSIDDFNRAQEEVLLAASKSSSPSHTAVMSPTVVQSSGATTIEQRDENRSTSSIFSSSSSSSTASSNDETSLVLEAAIRKFELDYSTVATTKMSKSSSYTSHIAAASGGGGVASLSPTSTTRTTSSTSLSATRKGASGEQQQFDDRFRKGLKLLREQLLRANALVREANSLCKEMSKPLRFRVTMQIPARNLVLLRKRNSLLTEPAILIKNKSKPVSSDPNKSATTNNEAVAPIANKTVIDLENFENLVIRLRESYTERQKVENNEETNTNDIESIFIDNESYYYKLIGVANLFLDVIVLNEPSPVPFEYDLPIMNQQGEMQGRLRVRVQLSKLSKDFGNASRIIRLYIERAYDLPVNLNNLVFCQYRWPPPPVATRTSSSISSDRPIIVTSKDSTDSAVFFDHEANLNIDASSSSSTLLALSYNDNDDDEDSFVEYCNEGGALSIEVLAHRTDIAKSMNGNSTRAMKVYNERLLRLNQQARMQALVEAWAKLSRSYEMTVRIMELNAEGNWSPVEVRNDARVKTGGIYQLRQGQSRQISVSVSQVSPDSALNYNGMLFSPEAHKIDHIWVGSVVCTDSAVPAAALDSYQEIDLNRLRDKCRTLLDQRKMYLYEQLKQLEQSPSRAAATDNTGGGGAGGDDDHRERYEALVKHLANLGDEQAACDAPPDGSHLPGATLLRWKPTPGMEEHVPIVFFDLAEDDLSGNWSNDTNADLNERLRNGVDEQEEGGGDDEDELGEEESIKESDEYFYDTEEFFDDELLYKQQQQQQQQRSRRRRKKKQHQQQQKKQQRRLLMVTGGENTLKYETQAQESTAYLDLKLVSWNDSSSMVVRDTTAAGRPGHDDDEIESHHQVDDDARTHAPPVLRATARWDSSEHKSKYLNRETPLDAHVYLIVKCNVKFKLYSAEWAIRRHEHSKDFLIPNSFKYIDVVLRKRICVSVNSPQNTSSSLISSSAAVFSSPHPTPSKLLSLNKLKNILSGSPSMSSSSSSSTPVGLDVDRRRTSRLASQQPMQKQHQQQQQPQPLSSQLPLASTSVTYRLIAAVPRLLAEAETRESMAAKAAALALRHADSSSSSSGDDDEGANGNGGSASASKKISIENSMQVFEHYARTMEAVETMLRRDRAHQHVAYKKALTQDPATTQHQPLRTHSSSPLKPTPQPPQPQQQQQKQASSSNSNTVKNNVDNKSSSSKKSTRIEEKSEKSESNKSSQESTKITPAPPTFETIREETASSSSSSIKKATALEALKIFEMHDALKKKSEEAKSVLLGTQQATKSEDSEATISGFQIESLLGFDQQQHQQQQQQQQQDHGLSGSNQSIASTLTNTSTKKASSSSSSQHHQHTTDSPTNEAAAAALPEWVREGACVIVSTNSVMNKRGRVRFVGETKFGTGTWIGVELEQATGKNDGTVKGHRYFTCPENRGVFVRADKLTHVAE